MAQAKDVRRLIELGFIPEEKWEQDWLRKHLAWKPGQRLFVMMLTRTYALTSRGKAWGLEGKSLDLSNDDFVDRTLMVRAIAERVTRTRKDLQ